MKASRDKNNSCNVLGLIEEKLNFINKSIYELNNYSNEDFKTLSSTFKKYYEDIMRIYTNTNNAFNNIISKHKNQVSVDIQIVEKFSKEIIETLQEIIKGFQVKQRDSNQLKNQLFMHINNLRQNIKTYELLLANISLNNEFGKHSNKEYELKEIELRELMRNAIREFSLNVEILKRNDELLSSVYFDEQSDNLVKLENPFFDKRLIDKLLAHDFSLIEKGNIHLEKTIDAATRSFSSIVTKLQYQDIISQSIQHILSSHLDILNQTRSCDELSPEELEAVLKKMKFMTMLQASQLIQVNKDYQDSIKVIIDKFDSLSSNVEALVELSDLLKSKNHINESFWIDIFLSMTTLAAIFESSSNSIKHLHKANNLLVSDIQTIAKLKKMIDEISTQVDFLYKMNSQHSDGAKSESELLNILNKDINKEIHEIDSLLKHLKRNTSETTESIIPKNLLEEMSGKIVSTIDYMNNHVEQLDNYNKELKQYVKVNMNLGMEISHNLKKSIHEIHYYTHFEKTAESIIVELEQLKNEIQADDSDIMDINTEELKKLYTVRTEHLVLNNLVSSSGLLKKNEDDDEGEIEFF